MLQKLDGGLWERESREIGRLVQNDDVEQQLPYKQVRVFAERLPHASGELPTSLFGQVSLTARLTAETRWEQLGL